MATDKAPSGSEKPVTKKKQRATLRSLIPYLVVAMAAAAMWGWYFFAYVPPQLQYFLGLRFRTLAVAAGQVKGKVESLSQAMGYAKQSEPSAAEYLDRVVPDLRRPAALGDGLDLEANSLTRRVAWDDVMTQAAAVASQRDFVDLLLASSDGQVLWQRERTSPRIGNLVELLEAPGEADGWFAFSFRWTAQTTPLKAPTKQTMPRTATSKSVNLDGHDSLLLVQPVSLTNLAGSAFIKKNEVDRLFVAGLVSRAALQKQAMHIPTEWVVRAALPFVLIFLALPFVKLVTITPKERYGFVDVVALGVAAILSVALGSSLPFIAASENAKNDKSLRDFAGSLDANLKDEVKELLALTSTVITPDTATQIEKVLARCDVLVRPFMTDEVDSLTRKPFEATRRCDLWDAWKKALLDAESSTPGTASVVSTSAQNQPGPVSTATTRGVASGSKPRKVSPGALELDVIVWVNKAGLQSEKWTTKRQITGQISQAVFEHFRAFNADYTWTLPDDTRRFLIEPLRSPTTSEMAFVFVVDSGNPERPMLALNAKPQSVVDPLVPPGYGFAIIAPDGRVLFHSQSELSLEENFFQEVGNADNVAGVVGAETSTSWTADYHGRRHRFFSRPTSFENCRWRILTFQEMEPLLAFAVTQQGGTVRLFCINLFVVGLAVGTVLVLWKAKGRDVRDLVMSTSLRSNRRNVVGKLIRWQMWLLAPSLAMLFSTYYAEKLGDRWLTISYVFFLVLPLVALALVGLIRSSAPPPRPSLKESDHLQLAVEIALLLLLIAGLPAAGFARIVYQVDEQHRTFERLKDSLEQSLSRQARVRGRVNATQNYSADTKKLVLNAGGFAATRLPDASVPYSYQHVLRNIRYQQHAPTGEPLTRTDSSTIEAVLLWARHPFWNVKSEPAKWQLFRNGSNDYHLHSASDKNLDTFTADYEAITNDVPLPRTLLGLSILGAVFWAVYWSRKKLSLPVPLNQCELRTLLTNVKPTDQNAAILLIGAPRLKKDRLVLQALESVTRKPPAHRISFLDTKLTPEWLDEQLAIVDRLAKSKANALGRIWIQVSNLEAQLVTAENRAQALRLLEKLMEHQPEQCAKGVIVTSAIDPVAHFAEVFHEECEQIYMDSIPEVELNRSSLILSRFRRCYVPLVSTSPWESWLYYDPRKWRQTLEREVGPYEPLADIKTEIEQVWKTRDEVPKADLRQAVRVKAAACYQLLWTSCTRSEKLVLIHLAQEGVVHPKNRDTFEELVAKGLVVASPSPAIFNYTFRDFLRRIERSEVVQEWERMEGLGVWVIAGRLVAVVAVSGGVFYLLTQGFSIQSMLPILSGSGLLGVPLLRELVARVSSGGASRATAVNA